MKRLPSIFVVFALALSGCRATKPVSSASAQELLMQDGKLLYELGRIDDACIRLQILLTETSDQRLRTSASYYLDRIGKGIPSQTTDPRVPHCFGP